jgi:signal transduction histidine kinase
MARRRSHSIGLPIVLSSITVALSAALLVGWILVILRNRELTRQLQVAASTTLLVAGIVSFAVIITVLVLFSVFLAREIREVRRQTSFIDSVTHELRSPLASIRLGLETLARADLASEQRDKLREMMLDDTERLSGFIDAILAASRLEHGEDIDQEIREVPLRSLVGECVVSVTRRHKVPADAVVVEVPGEIHVRTDPTALEVVVKNLLDNALKYSNPPYEVRVEARVRDRETVVIAVADTGLGIPRRDLKRVFQRFYRVPDRAASSRRGTGLGLFVASAQVRSLGGRLRARSNGRGSGTTIEVLLPCAANVGEAAPGPAERKAHG